MNRRLLLPVALSLLALFATACPEENRAPADDASVAGPDAALVEPADAAQQPEPPDAAAPGPDAGPVVPPLRTLVPAHLMGEAPVDNRVMAPNFDPGAEQWYAVRNGTDLADAQLIAMPRAPVNGLPILKVLPAGTDDLYLVGTVRGGKAPLLASVWIGRDSTASQDLTLDFAVQGLTASAQTDETFVLLADPDSEQTIDRIRWTRYSARIEQELLGFASMVGYDATGQIIYFLAPALVQVPDVDTRGFAKARPAIKRKPTVGEAKAVKAFWEKKRRSPPPPRFKL